MGRSRRYLLFALAMVAIALFALPATASAQDGGTDLNCSDFTSQSDAQSTYVNQSGDPDNLDDDNDGSACEDYDYSVDVDYTSASDDAYVRDVSYPRRGIASGGGSDAPDGMSPVPFVASAGLFALLALGSWGLSLRRRLGR